MLELAWGGDDNHLDAPFDLPLEVSHIGQERRRVPPALHQATAGELHSALMSAVEGTSLRTVRRASRTNQEKALSCCNIDSLWRLAIVLLNS